MNECPPPSYGFRGLTTRVLDSLRNLWVTSQGACPGVSVSQGACPGVSVSPERLCVGVVLRDEGVGGVSRCWGRVQVCQSHLWSSEMNVLGTSSREMVSVSEMMMKGTWSNTSSVTGSFSLLSSSSDRKQTTNV